jgi:hypothetical protein
MTVSRNWRAGVRQGKKTAGRFGFGCAEMRFVFFLSDGMALQKV